MTVHSIDGSVKIRVICPICKKQGTISVPPTILKNIYKPLATIRIQKEIICVHEFFVYIDRNFKSRGSQVTDYVASPTIQKEELKSDETKIEDLKIKLIKLNLYRVTLSYLLWGLLHRNDVLFLINEELSFLRQYYINFIEFIFSGSFDIKGKLVIETGEDYHLNKKKYKNSLIIKNMEIIQDKRKFIKSHDLGVERGMANLFFDTDSEIESVKYLHSEIKKAYLFSKSVMNYLNEREKKKELHMNELLEYLEKKYDTKINVRYGEFLIQIVKYYFNENVPHLYKDTEFSKFFKLSNEVRK